MNPSRPSVHLPQDAAYDEPRVRTSRPFGHSYSDIKSSDNARVHVGDVHNHNQNHYGGIHDGKSTEDRLWEEFLKALSFERMDFRLAAITPAQGETCRWIFHSPEYLRWRNPSLRSSHRGLFWIKGKAGVGKSTIMRCILEDAIDSMPGHCMISFFFNARGNLLESSVEGMYRSLLLQLLRKIPRLRNVVTLPQIPVKSQTWEPAVLQDIFRKAVLGLKGERVICLVDALDEGDQAGVRSMVKFLEDLTEANISLEVCFASRHYPTITVKYCESIIIERITEHAEDIHFYVSNELRVTHGALRDELQLELVRKSQAVFLWVVIVIRRLNEAFDDGAGRADLFEIVRKLPDGLRELLDDIVSKSATNQQLTSAVVWMLFAQYNLNVREFYYAIRLSLHHFQPGDMVEWCCHSAYMDEDLEHMQRFVLSAGRGLVEVKSLPRSSQYSHHFRGYHYKSSGPYEKYDDSYFDHLQVQFIHETVRDYFLMEGLARLRPDLQPGVVSKSHALLARRCMRWVNSAAMAFRNLPKESANKSSGTLVLDADTPKPECDWTRFPLFTYVRYSTLKHLNAAYLGGAIHTATLQAFPTQQWIDINRVAQDFETLRYADSATLLYFLLAGEFREFAKWHLETLTLALPSKTPGSLFAQMRYFGSAGQDTSNNFHPLNAFCGGYYYDSLVAAAYHGYSDIVQLLLDHGADPMIPAIRGYESKCTLLHEEIDEYRRVHQVLLAHRQDSNAHRCRYGENWFSARERQRF